MLGLRPWFALLRRALTFRFWVRLDMAVRLSAKFEPDSGDQAAAWLAVQASKSW